LNDGILIRQTGADATFQSKVNGETALHWCCRLGLVAASLQLLDQYHVSADVTDQNGWTPLMMACQSRSSPIVQVTKPTIDSTFAISSLPYCCPTGTPYSWSSCESCK
jgi:ankyrin repeat protein